MCVPETKKSTVPSECYPSPFQTRATNILVEEETGIYEHSNGISVLCCKCERVHL